MVHHRGLICAAAFGAALHLTSCGSGVGNAAPRVSVIPAQATAGGSMFSLDVSKYVQDRENGTLFYTVKSGGGSFSGSTYNHTFDTLGEFTVEITVSDTEGKTSDAKFTVKVNTANLAVISEGDDLQLLETDTEKFTIVTSAGGFVDTYKAALSKGHVVYERSGPTTRLFAFNPNNKQTVTLGESEQFSTTFAAKTSDNRIVHMRAPVGDPSDTDLYIWNSETGMIKAISAVKGDPDGSAMVNGDNLVFYQKNSPADVYYYDPTTDTSTAVATGATAETLQAVLPNNAVVLTRIGGGGETDLFYYKLGSGLVEIGADLSQTIKDQTKTYKGRTSDSKVVFEVTGATAIDLYMWDPGSGASRVVATNGVNDTFAAVTALDEVVYNTATGPTDNDISIYTYSTDTTRAISPVDAVNDIYQGALSNGDVVILRETGTGDDLHLYDTSGSSLGGLATASADDYSFNKVLSGDKVAYTLAGGGGGVFVVNTTGVPAPVTVGGPGSVFGGETTGGDFVVHTLVAAQFDLALWDESATAVVTISSVTGDDSFGGAANGNRILFLRKAGGKTTTDLFVWDPADLTTVQLTDTSLNHAVVATFAADNS